MGAGAAEGAVDAANILKPALGRGDIQVIGATTLDEYRKIYRKGCRSGAPFPAGSWSTSRTARGCRLRS